jgi:hypothetical protein
MTKMEANLVTLCNAKVRLLRIMKRYLTGLVNAGDSHVVWSSEVRRYLGRESPITGGEFFTKV